MSSISFPVSNQAKLSGWIVHPVKQRMARRAEYPNSVERRVRLGAPSAVAAVLGLVSNVKNSRIPAGLAFTRRVRVANIEAFQVAIRAKLRSGFYVIFFRLIGVFIEKLRSA